MEKYISMKGVFSFDNINSADKFFEAFEKLIRELDCEFYGRTMELTEDGDEIFNTNKWVDISNKPRVRYNKETGEYERYYK